MNSPSNKILPALYGGIIMALVSTIPIVSFINCLCCAGILLGGFLAVLFYKNSLPPDAPPLNSSDCMILGLYAGLIGAVIGAFLSSLFLAIFGNVTGEMIQNLISGMNIPIPEESLRKLQESTATSVTVRGFVIQLVTSLVVNSIFGMLGGVIGYSLFKSKFMPPMARPPVAPTS